MSDHLEKAKLLAANGKYKAAADSLYYALPTATAGDLDEAQAILDLVGAIRAHDPKQQAACDEIEESVRQALDGGHGIPSQERIHLTSEGKRQALDWLVNSEGKYGKPFSGGNFSAFSVVGTRSWSDYASVVLQMMIADSLLNIEEKLDRLLADEE